VNASIDAHARDQEHQLAGSVGSISPEPISGSHKRSKDEAITEKHNRLRPRHYGGRGDRLHLGGFTAFDSEGVSNNTFNYMLSELAVKSFLDVGCGRGISTRYFLDHGARVLCVEGSADAIRQSYLPREVIVDHDYSKGPYWPSETFDAVWSVEFLEHVSRQYMRNYLPTFRRAALIFVTASTFGGWHHIEVRNSTWWDWRFTAAGFVYSPELTQMIRLTGCQESGIVKKMSVNLRREGEHPELAGKRICRGMRVYINPPVAALPQHDHIFGGHGCIWGDDTGIKCEGGRYRWWDERVDAVPLRYQSLLECKVSAKNEFLLEPCVPNVPAMEENKQRTAKAKEQAAAKKRVKEAPKYDVYR
jgi:SAM-dependent methyltransferase